MPGVDARYLRNDPRQSNQMHQQYLNDQIPLNKPGETQAPNLANPRPQMVAPSNGNAQGSYPVDYKQQVAPPSNRNAQGQLPFGGNVPQYPAGQNYPNNVKDFQQSNRNLDLPADKNSKQFPPRPQDPGQYGQGMRPNQYPGSQDFRPYPPGQDPRQYPPRPDLNQKPVRQAPGPEQYPNQPNTNLDSAGSKQSLYPSRPDSNQQPGEVPNNSKDNLGLKSMNQYPPPPSNSYPQGQDPRYPPRPGRNEAKPPGVPPQNYPKPNAGQNMNPPSILDTQNDQLRGLPESPGSPNHLPPKPSNPNQVDPGMPPPVKVAPPDRASQPLNVPGVAPLGLDLAGMNRPPDRASQPLNVPGVAPGGLDQAGMDRPPDRASQPLNVPGVKPGELDQASMNRPPVAPPNPVQVDKPDLDVDKKSRILGKISPKSSPQNSQNALDQNGL